MIDSCTVLELLGSMRTDCDFDSRDVAVALRKLDTEESVINHGVEIIVGAAVVAAKMISLEGAHGIMPMLGEEALYRMLIKAKHEEAEKVFKWLQLRKGLVITDRHKDALLELAKQAYPAKKQDLANRIDLEFATAKA